MVWSISLKINFDLFKGESGNYFFINGMTALAFSFIIPIMALFLVEELGIEPGYIGFYTVGTALCTMVSSQLMGGAADRGADTKRLFLFCLAGLGFGAGAFSVIDEFWQALLVGMFLMSIGASSVPMLLTMIRKYAERSGKNSTKINTQMRSSVSLLWIVGPALGFASVDQFGFRANFVIAMLIALGVWFFAVMKLPAGVKRTAKKQNEPKTKLSGKVWYLGIAIFFANLANSTYLNAMPLYLTKELGFSLSLPGLLIGMTAALEIPTMLWAGAWGERLGKIRMVTCSFIFAILFYVGIQFASETWHFIALQLLNGIFFGVFVGLGVTLLQDYAQEAIGKASAFYTNSMSIGTMCGTSLMGLVAQYYSFKTALMTSMFAVTVSLLMFVLFGIYSQRFKLKEQLTTL